MHNMKKLQLLYSYGRLFIEILIAHIEGFGEIEILITVCVSC